ncbi:MAG: DUF6057 family protein, partial [Prevotella sp.]|nr:DUF6057 family protein [Prevotella sp.]
LSGGQTHYDRTIGAVLITGLLYLLQLTVYGLTHFSKLAHALTYFPSLLLLTFLTSFDPDQHGCCSFGAWLFVLPLLLLVYVGCVYWLRKYGQFAKAVSSAGVYSPVMWVNLLCMALMFFMVGAFSNHSDQLHYRVHAEQCLISGDYDGALAAGAASLVEDSSLTMLRVFALSKKGQLGERLFEYPVTGGAESLLPNGHTVRLLMLPEKAIYMHLGLWTKQRMDPVHYLRFNFRHHVAKRPAVDYLLCAYLLDRDLDRFAQAVQQYYDLEKPLPKHYEEALTLYTHLRSNPTVVFHQSVIETDFQDFQDLLRRHPNKMERNNAVRDTYGNTYWYYFLIASKARTQLQSIEN